MAGVGAFLSLPGGPNAVQGDVVRGVTRYLNGEWDAAVSINGAAYIWSAKNSTVGAPTAIDQVNAGTYFNGANPCNNPIRKLAIMRGAFTSDAEINTAFEVFTAP